ncbi:hypothetical protein BH24ACI4_BH24ACI4_10480 [soil metagenome]
MMRLQDSKRKQILGSVLIGMILSTIGDIPKISPDVTKIQAARASARATRS